MTEEPHYSTWPTDDDLHDRLAELDPTFAADVAAQREFGRQLRAAREAAGLTQTQLAERAGISRRATIAELEAGVGNPRFSTILKLRAGLQQTDPLTFFAA